MMKATRFLFIAPALLSSAASFQPTTPFSSRDIIRTTHSQPSFNLQKVETLAKVMSSDSNTSPSESKSISNGVAAVPSRHPHCDLPGDPSLILTTNVDLGDAKGNILKKLSALVATSTGKPEAYVGE